MRTGLPARINAMISGCESSTHPQQGRIGDGELTEGTSALFALTSDATAPDKVIDELKHYDDFEIISTNLPAEQEAQLREAFAS